MYNYTGMIFLVYKNIWDIIWQKLKPYSVVTSKGWPILKVGYVATFCFNPEAIGGNAV